MTQGKLYALVEELKEFNDWKDEGGEFHGTGTVFGKPVLVRFQAFQSEKTDNLDRIWLRVELTGEENRDLQFFVSFLVYPYMQAEWGWIFERYKAARSCTIENVLSFFSDNDPRGLLEKQAEEARSTFRAQDINPGFGTGRLGVSLRKAGFETWGDLEKVTESDLREKLSSTVEGDAWGREARSDSPRVDRYLRSVIGRLDKGGLTLKEDISDE